MALFNIAAIWLAVTLAALVAVAPHRQPRDGGQSQRRRRAMARAPQLARELTRSLAHALSFAMGRGRRHHRDRRADDVLQSRSSGAVHAGRDLVVGPDVAGGGQAARLHRHLRYHRRAAAGVRGVDGGQWRRTPSSSPSPRSASSTAIPARRSAGRSISCRRRIQISSTQSETNSKSPRRLFMARTGPTGSVRRWPFLGENRKPPPHRKVTRLIRNGLGAWSAGNILDMGQHHMIWRT